MPKTTYRESRIGLPLSLVGVMRVRSVENYSERSRSRGGDTAIVACVGNGVRATLPHSYPKARICDVTAMTIEMRKTGVDLHGDMPWGTLICLFYETPPDLFHVVQESLTNIQRHSGSRKAKIRIERDPGMIALEISDEGSGIQGNLRRRNGNLSFGLGVGIPSMQERVKLIGGQLDIESNGRGTAVRVTIPVDD